MSIEFLIGLASFDLAVVAIVLALCIAALGKYISKR